MTTSSFCIDAVSKWQAKLAERHVRGVLWLTGSPGWYLDTMEGLVKQQTGPSQWVGDKGIKPAAATQLLGTELCLILYDTRSGMHPNGLAAMLGALQGGGMLVLGSPRPRNWLGQGDSDYQRLGVFEQPPKTQYFFKRLLSWLGSQPYIWQIDEQLGGTTPSLEGLDVLAPAARFCLTDSQLKVVEAGLKVVHGHRRRPLLVTADRGRGKSTALAETICQLVRLSSTQVIVTAGAESGAAVLRQYVDAQLEELSASVIFITPDKLLQDLPTCGLLVIDEAAGIPLPTLSTLMSHYSRVIAATTLGGYEGTGRGFQLKFLPELARVAPQYRHLTLQQPVRWSSQDLLEPDINRTLLLNVELEGIEGDLSPAIFCWIDQADLASNEKLLEQVFGLLLQAHYRTRPDDLRVLLDAPNVRIAAACNDQRVTAVALVAVEGELPLELEGDVSKGHRRLKGHLLPQMMATNSEQDNWFSFNCWRIARIAVHPLTRLQGLGSGLLKWITQQALDERVDLLGTSFGAAEQVLPFWQQCEYLPAWLGAKANSYTGGHSLLLIQPLGNQAKQHFQQHRVFWSGLLPLLLQEEGHQQNWELVAQLALSDGREVAECLLTSTELLAAFLQHNGAYEPAINSLVRLAWIGLAADKWSVAQKQLVVEKLVFHRSWPAVIESCGFQGKAQALKELKRALLATYIEEIKN